MKRFMLQMLRSLVTIVVVGTMAVMIFSLRDERQAAKAEIASLRAQLIEAQAR